MGAYVKIGMKSVCMICDVALLLDHEFEIGINIRCYWYELVGMDILLVGMALRRGGNYEYAIGINCGYISFGLSLLLVVH